jgi:hypothetical protein
LLSGQSAAPEGDAARLALAVAIETTDALARMAFRRDPDGDPEVLRECKDLIQKYLRARLR